MDGGVFFPEHMKTLMMVITVPPSSAFVAKESRKAMIMVSDSKAETETWDFNVNEGGQTSWLRILWVQCEFKVGSRLAQDLSKCNTGPPSHEHYI